ALSRHRAPCEGHVCDADLRLPGVRRIRDDRRRRQQWLDRRRPRDDGEPARLQARRRGWDLDIFCAEGRGEVEGGFVGGLGEAVTHQDLDTRMVARRITPSANPPYAP